MTDPKMTMEVPPQVREFARKSVDQAEKAVSTFMDSANNSVAMAPGPMTEVKSSFDHARTLMEAKDIGEVMQLQTEFLRNQFSVATDQFRKITSGAAGGDEA